MKKQAKFFSGIIAAIAVLVVAIISIVITVAGGSKNTYNSHMELAQRYLDELQYEQAIAEYEAAIAIDPKNPEAYLGLAEVYIAMDNIEKALEVLTEGYAQTQSERIATRLEELKEELAREQGGLSEENLDREEQASEADQAGELVGNAPGAETSQVAPPITFVPWDEAGLEDHVMDWKDENLEVAMRDETEIYDRDIMLSDVWELTGFYGEDCQISDIGALGELTNLQYLFLEYNRIKDISALSSLTNLFRLHLSSNQISDISALSGLTNLYALYLDDNQISDISALSGLTNLGYLWLEHNQISDISALSGLNVFSLSLSYNQISDIGALSGLPYLYDLYLYNNPIEDYSPVEFVEQQNEGGVQY